MNYIENIYICLVAPILIAAFCVRRQGRTMLLFVVSGMTACLLSSYISTFLAAASGADMLTASLTLAPLVEEIMKMIPILFFILVFDPHKGDLSASVMMTAVGFATFENVCYLAQNGAEHLSHLAIRGFGTGAMHVVCGAIIGIGIISFWDQVWLKIGGTMGLLSVTTTYHGIYNLLVAQKGTPAYVGYFIPIFTTFAVVIPLRNHLSGRPVQ